MSRDEGYEEIPAYQAGRTLDKIDRRALANLRAFASQAHLSSFPLTDVDDCKLLALLRNGIKSRDWVLLREGHNAAGAEGDSTTSQRRLVRAIEAAARGRLSYAGRQYRLVADADLSKLPDRDSYEVVRRDDAAQILAGIARQGGVETGELAKVLGQAQGKLSADWRPPLAPDGLILLRRIVVARAPTNDTGPAITPSQLKKLVTKADWIEIEVVDQDGEPYAGPYHLELPDATSSDGDFDAEGFFGNYALDPGTCQLVLTERKEVAGAADVTQTEETATPATNEPSRPGQPISVVPESLDVQEFSVSVVDELDQPIAAVPMLFQSVGAVFPAVTDDSGIAKCKVPGTESVQVVFASPEALAQLVKPIWTASRGAERKDWVQANDTTTTVTLLGGQVVKCVSDSASTGTPRPGETLESFLGVQTTVDRPAKLSVQPLVIFVRMLGEHFDIDKSFLLPKALDSVRDLVRLHKDYALTDLLIVGHTDTSATEAYNLDLSLERTSTMRAYLTNDAASWLAWYGDDKKASKRWGATEDAHMIGTAVGGSAFPATVLGYQQWHNAQAPRLNDYADLAEDGEIGPRTRKQLILDYMHREDTTVPDGTAIQVHGCGEFFPLDPSGEGLSSSAPDGQHVQQDRRVEVFLFPGEIGMLPPVPGDKASQGEAEYPEWRRRSIDFELLAAKLGQTIVLVDENEKPLAGIPVMASGPGFSQAYVTDASGAAVLQNAPLGGVALTVPDLKPLATALSPLLSLPPRSAKYPTDIGWVVVTPTKLTGSLALGASPITRIMVVARTNVGFDLPDGWEDLAPDADGPWQLEKQDGRCTLKLVSVGARQTVTLQCPAPESPVLAGSFPATVAWTPDRRRITQPGDTLASIAGRYLGDPSQSDKVLALNPELGSAVHPVGPLPPGTTITLPAEAIPDWLDIPTLETAGGNAHPDVFATLDIDALHDAMFTGDDKTVWGVLDAFPTEPRASGPGLSAQDYFDLYSQCLLADLEPWSIPGQSEDSGENDAATA